MNILHVVADHSPASGGVFRAIEDMGRAMEQRGHRVEVVCTGSLEPGEGSLRRTAYPRQMPQGLYASPGFRVRITEHVSAADVLHVHSNWTLPVWRGCAAASRMGKPLIHSPHGALGPASLRHHAWRKRLVWFLDRRALKGADCILVSGEREAEWVWNWMPALKDRITVIPPGVEAMGETPASGGRDRRLVYIGRLHPMKGVDLLLRAWAGTRRREPERSRDWEWVVAGGGGETYVKMLKGLSRDLGLDACVRFTGPLDRGACLELLRNAAVAVLPSRSENFGMVVAEAMACATPVVTTTATPWDGVLNREPRPAGWVVEPTVTGLEAALSEAVSVSESSLHERGVRGERILREEYSWTRFGDRLEAMYAGVVG